MHVTHTLSERVCMCLKRHHSTATSLQSSMFSLMFSKLLLYLWMQNKCSLLYEKICWFTQKWNKDTSMQSKSTHSRHVHLQIFQIAVQFYCVTFFTFFSFFVYVSFASSFSFLICFRNEIFCVSLFFFVWIHESHFFMHVFVAGFCIDNFSRT